MAVRLVYIDTNVIADWIFLKALSEESELRTKLRASLASFHLINHIFEFYYEWSARYKFISSEIALLESLSVVKEGTQIFYLFVEDLSLKYFPQVKRELVISEDDKDAILYSIYEFQELAEKSIKLYKPRFDIDDAIEFILEYCLEPMDAIHLAIATKYNADFFITRDRMFLQSAKKKIEEELGIRPLHPREFLEELTKQ